MINNEKKFFGDRKKEEKKNYKFMQTFAVSLKGRFDISHIKLASIEKAKIKEMQKLKKCKN